MRFIIVKKKVSFAVRPSKCTRGCYIIAKAKQCRICIATLLKRSNYFKYKTIVTDIVQTSLSGFGESTVDVPLIGQVVQDTVIGQ